MLGSSILKNSKRMLIGARTVHLHNISKNIQLIRKDESSNKTTPLVILMAWMLAHPKHLKKYAEMYIKKNCDILTVSITPWQLLWPTTGSQLVASDLANFLHGEIERPLLIHGFSVGAYVWSETIVKLQQLPDSGASVVKRIHGQIWDSAADESDIELGFPKAVFPSNFVMENLMRGGIRLHHSLFYSAGMVHYLKGSQAFKSGYINAPALFLVSKKDPVGSVGSNMKVKNAWDSVNIKTHWKCFEDSIHVGHFLKYPDEYKKEVSSFLDEISFPPTSTVVEKSKL